MVFWATNQPEGEIVAAVAGKQIRVRRVILCTDSNAAFYLRNGSDAAIAPAIILRPAGTCLADITYRDVLPQTPAGSAMKLYYGGAVLTTHSIWLEYVLV